MLFFALSISFSYAVIDIKPSEVIFNSIELGQDYSKVIRITPDSESNVLMNLKLSGDLKENIKVSPVRRIINRNLPADILIEVEDAKNTEGVISFCFASEDSSMISANSESCIGVKVKLSELEGSKQLSVSNLIFKPGAEGEVSDFSFNINNRDNKRHNLVLEVNGVKKEFSVEAYEEGVKHIPLKVNDKVGFNNINVAVKDGEEVSFYDEISYERPDRTIKQVDSYLVPSKSVMVNESLKVYSILKNKGGAGINCEAKIQVFKNDVKLEEYETSTYCGADEAKQISFEFIPYESGEYVIKSEAYFGQSFSQDETVVMVVDSSDAVGLSAGYLGFFALMIGIIVYFQKSMKNSLKKVKKKTRRAKK